MMLEKFPELRNLTTLEKLHLVGELWDDVATHQDEIPVSRELIEEMDRELEEYRRDPSKGRSWEEVQVRILGRPLRSA